MDIQQAVGRINKRLRLQGKPEIDASDLIEALENGAVDAAPNGKGEYVTLDAYWILPLINYFANGIRMSPDPGELKSRVAAANHRRCIADEHTRVETRVVDLGPLRRGFDGSS